MALRSRHVAHPDMVPGLDTAGLRAHFLVEGLFRKDALELVYSHAERLLVGGAAPESGPVALAPQPLLAADHVLQRREMGVINIGGPGVVRVDGAAHALDPKDGLYIGRGAGEVTFESAGGGRPARFYLVSAPAHAAHPTRKIAAADARPMKLGAKETCNERTIYQYVNPDMCASAQLLLGLTALAPGSVWNTMPCHVHDRRSEVYFYFDLAADARVVHLMGRPSETRSLIVKNEEAVVSPPWSIHCGAGTASYAFVWAMAGENQDYKDLEVQPMDALR